MKALGIVAEYNPFHNGHKYHIDRSLIKTGADILIVIMSGNFMERGEPAILDKWERSKIAIKNGANIVIELPTLCTLSNAGYFAKGAINILESLGVSDISFGVSTKNYEMLIDIANFIKENEESIENEIKSSIKEGLSYPKLRENIIVKSLGEEYKEVLSEPNNILAIEYLKNMKSSNPVFVDRYMVNHNETFKDDYASGSYIRGEIRNGLDVNKYLPYNYEFKNNNMENELFKEIQSLALTKDQEYLNSIFGAEEGLGSIIKNRFRYWTSYSDIKKDLKSKRYTETRINRVLLDMLLGIKKEDIVNMNLYARLLAFDEKGRSYLKEIKKENRNIPIITNINKDITENIKDTINFDIKASDLYNKINGNNLYEKSDFVTMPSRF